MQRIVIAPDIQYPLHDRRLVQLFTDFLADYRPDRLVLVGDVTDSTEVARWSRGYAEEHGNLQAAFDGTFEMLRGFRRAMREAPIDVERSNHDARLSKYVAQYAPALASLRGLRIESLLRLDEIDVRWHHVPIEVAPGWLVMHGDEGRMSQYAGWTALKLAQQVGRSVACGHTHRAGLVHDNNSYGGKVTRNLWGLEVGHFMDMRKATYLGTGGANWQQAFGVLYVDGGKVVPHLVPVRDRSFVLDGVIYR